MNFDVSCELYINLECVWHSQILVATLAYSSNCSLCPLTVSGDLRSLREVSEGEGLMPRPLVVMSAVTVTVTVIQMRKRRSEW
jgi:hypothetical protein